MPIFTPEVEITNTPLTVDGSAFTQPVSGSVSVSGSVTVANPGLTDTELRATPVPISGTITATGPLTDSQLRATPVPISGSVSTTPLSAASSTVTQVTSTGSNQTLLAANANRKRAIFYFSSGIWHVKFGVGASATSRTYNVSSSNTTLEVTVWTGQIDALCTTASKIVDVTELS